MPLTPVQEYPAGGVDSRSNPLAMPGSRYLHVHDFWPQQDGSFRLRDGYALLKGGVAGIAIHSITSVTGPAPNYVPLIVFWQDKTPYVFDQVANTVTPSTVKGVAVQSNARFCYFYTNGHLHAFNGTDAKWFDGIVWRDIGLPALTDAQIATFKIAPGVPELTSTQASAINLATATGGGFPGDTIGRSVYVVLLDTSIFLSSTNSFAGRANELGPATISVGSGPIKVPISNKLNLTGLPNLSAVDTSFVKLIAITEDGGLDAHFCTNTSTPVTSFTPPSGSSGNSTITSVGHGLTAGDIVFVEGASSKPEYCVLYVEAIIDVDNFRVSIGSNVDPTYAPTVVKRIVSASNTAATATVADGTVETSYIVNQDRGIAASSIGGAQPGYQFFASIYNPTTGHVGNRKAFGNRFVPAARSNVYLIFNFALPDSEWTILPGRSSDGAEIPYATIDTDGNWGTLANSVKLYGGPKNAIFIKNAEIDGDAELPSRNFPPPGTLDYNAQLAALAGGAAKNPPIIGTFKRAWVESDHCCGTLQGSPTIYRSGSAQDEREGTFVGLPEQSWDPADLETFPTGQPVVSGHGYEGESWVYSRQDSGALMELAGVTQWQGPWNIGCAGQFAWARGWQNLPFWVTGQKQLATVSLGGIGGQPGPVPISGEYEAALLSKIGDQYLDQTEVVYIRIPNKLIDVLRIKCIDKNGKPFTIIHDFNLRDGNSPYGQAYEEDLLGPLATLFTQATVRDQNEIEQVVAGGADGNLYELYSGGNDSGTEFTAEALSLVGAGPNRTAIKKLEWWGDQNLHILINKQLDTPFDPMQFTDLCEDTPVAVQGEEKNSHWSVDGPEESEVVNAYLLLQLTSHSADGTTDLNSPPHIPLETYGRIWMAEPLAGKSRGR